MTRWKRHIHLVSAADAEAQGVNLALAPMKRFVDGAFRSVDVGALFPDCNEGVQANPSCMLWRADFLPRIGDWDERTRMHRDGEIVTRALLEEATVAANRVETLAGLMDASQREAF